MAAVIQPIAFTDITPKQQRCIIYGLSRKNEPFYFEVLEQNNIFLSPEQEDEFNSIIANEIIKQLRQISDSEEKKWFQIKSIILALIAQVNLDRANINRNKMELLLAPITRKIVEEWVKIEPETIYYEIRDLFPTYSVDFIFNALLAVLTTEQLITLYLHYRNICEAVETKE